MPKSVLLNQIYYEAHRDTPSGFFVRHLEKLNTSSRFHFHKKIELIYIKEGYIEFDIEQNRSFSAKPGELLFLDEWTLHRVTRCDQGDYLMMLIPNSYSEQFHALRENRTYTVYVLSDNEHHLLYSLIFSVYERVRKDAEAISFSKAEKQCLISAVNTLLSEIYTRAQFTDGERSVNEILPIVAYIFDHMDSHFTIKDLSHKFGFSPRHLSRSFKEFSEQHMELKDYIDAVRLERAKTLLKQGMAVNKACETSGFGSLRSFHRVFFENVGTTPGSYRKAHLPQSNIT